ncbi:hypothetical protein [Planctobacterium marinum]|uniref:hypothetical protein n=1 Tax=Planctobacterium marinum TaxID=1631968 RepID=UPI001E4231DF|nr:hypothetical protein [Planctobacterium marinum]MCC2604672.1 hypothetical protein [Planctobacterium marinum]
MNHLIQTLPFIIFAIVIVMLLAHSDPRRRQLFEKSDVKRRVDIQVPVQARKWLAWSLVLPLIALTLMANYAGILMYAGALTVIGWLVSELPASVV